MARGLQRLKMSDVDSAKKKKVLLLEQILRHWQLWRVMYEENGLETIVILGEEWNILDLLKGIERLPPRQKQALWLVVVEDMKQADAAMVMFSKDDGATVGQYKDAALLTLVTFHEQLRGW